MIMGLCFVYLLVVGQLASQTHPEIRYVSSQVLQQRSFPAIDARVSWTSLACSGMLLGDLVS